MNEKEYQNKISELEETTKELDEQLKLVLKNETKLHETKRRLEKEVFRYKILQKISELVASSLDIDDTVTFVGTRLVSDLECEKAVILILEEETIVPRFWFGYNKEEVKAISNLSFSTTEGLIGKICKEKSTFVRDYASFEEKNAEVDTIVTSFFIERFQLIPLELIREKRLIGLLLIGNSIEKRNIYPYPWEESDFAIFFTLANQIANVIENSRLYMRLLKERVELKRTKEELERLNESLNQMVIRKTKELREAEKNITTAKEKVITFTISGERYATYLFQVKEVLEKKEIMKIPSYPDFIEGASVIRGHILLVVKLQTLLGLEETQEGQKQIMVVDYNNKTFGFMVDAIEGIESIYKMNIVDVPSYLRATNKLKLVEQVVKISEHKIAGLLDLHHIIEVLPIGDIHLDHLSSQIAQT